MSNLSISSLEDDLRRLQIAEKQGQCKRQSATVEKSVPIPVTLPIQISSDSAVSKPTEIPNPSDSPKPTEVGEIPTPEPPSKKGATIQISSSPPRSPVQSRSPISSDYLPSISPNPFVPRHTIESICKGLNNGIYKKVVVMCGAGISVAAGIPDFRTPGTGLYDNLQKYNLPTPQAVFSLDFFRSNPLPFCNLAKELYPGKIKPTDCHNFVLLLASKGILLRCFTQNIDGLERLAGVPVELLMEAHGGFSEAHCIDCHKSVSSELVKEILWRDEVPRCELCNGLVKPDIVFFGESLPKQFSQFVLSDFPQCDLLIVMGTSLQVKPFADLIDFVSPQTPRVLLNRELAGNFLQGRQQERDVAILGDCQSSVQQIIRLSGWKQ